MTEMYIHREPKNRPLSFYLEDNHSTSLPGVDPKVQKGKQIYFVISIMSFFEGPVDIMTSDYILRGRLYESLTLLFQ